MRVAPENVATTLPTSAPKLSFITNALERCSHLWHRMHISHRGAYSVERLAAFADFCSETSTLRAFLTCCLLPVPAFITAVMIELIPLRDPHEGWQPNYSAWIREIVAGIGVSVGFIVQTSALMPLVVLKPIQVICIAILTATLTTLLQIGIASVWIFPIPFGYILAGPAFFSFLFSSCFFLLKKQMQDPDFVLSLRQQIFVLATQGFFAIVYCAFCTAYYNLPASNQPFFVLGLPIIKFAMQHAVAWAASHIQEYMPGIAVFSVEVFNALYVAKCMQSAGSPLTNALLIALDIFHGMRSFHHMNKEMSQLTQIMELGDNNLVRAIFAACRQPNVLSTITKEHDIHVRSSLHLQLSEHGSHLVNQLEKLQLTQQGSQAFLFAENCEAIPPIPCCATNPHELNPQKSGRSFTNITNINPPQRSSLATISKQQEFVHRALKIFFQCEYHALVEYIECVIPMVYTVYIAILCQLPSAEFQPETRNLATERIYTMITNVLIYVCWEMLSFIVLHFAVRWRFGFSLVHLLAFVLKSRSAEFQGRLLAIFCYIFSVTVVHYGTS